MSTPPPPTNDPAMTRSKLTFLHYLAALFATCCARCAQTVSIKSWNPAPVQMTGIRRIAIATFDNGDESGRRATMAMADRVHAHPLYDVVGPLPAREEEQALSYGDAGDSDLARLASHVGADAVVVGTVSRTMNNQGSFQLGDSILRVTMSCRLIDTRSGQIRIAKSIERTFRYHSDMDFPTDKSVEENTRRLVEECVSEFVESTLAQADEFEVSLARTDEPETESVVDSGIELAKSGNWRQAKRQWRNALTAARDDDAALYNLGVAHEATLDYRQAASMYQAALSLNDDDKYREALDRVRQSQRNYRMVMGQQESAGDLPAGPVTIRTSFSHSQADRGSVAIAG